MDEHTLRGLWARVGHAPWIYVVMALVLGIMLLDLVANWRIVRKTGHAGILSLLFYIPAANFILWFAIAFGEWPRKRE